jgi:hypothetical protein
MPKVHKQSANGREIRQIWSPLSGARLGANDMILDFVKMAIYFVRIRMEKLPSALAFCTG